MAPPDRLRSPRPGSGLSLSVLDLAQIRALVESTGMLGGSTCPSCEMPFDKGKKRRLIDSCGHERCYSCLFRSEACPLCLRANFNDDDDLEGIFREEFTGSSGPVSILAPTDSWIDESSTVNSLCGSPKPRTKVTTRANLLSRVMHQRDAYDSVSCAGMTKGLKNKPPTLPEGRQKLQMMTQSCPTPPNQRKRFFLNPKVLRSSFVPQRSSRRGASSPEPTANDNPSALSVWMASSWEGKSRWPGVVLGKIKSLWSNSQGTANDGLNQLIDSTCKITDDEGGCVKPLSSKTRKSSQSDLHMRLGLLLGSNHVRTGSNIDTTDLPGVSNRSNAGACHSRVPVQGHDSSAASFSSLTSFETQTLTSTNTSPVSTLTGASSEAEAVAALRCPTKLKTKAKGKSKSSRDCDSAGSLASISTSISASTSMSMSMSVSVSGLSNGSSSPLTPRRHSVNSSQPGQSDEPGEFKNRRSCARRSARTGNVKGAVNTRLRLMQHHAAQLTLKPLFFEVPLLETDPLFTGRQWLLHELELVVNGSSPGVLISGSPGTGKTALVLQLVEHSCFGRRREQPVHSFNEEVEEKEKIGCTSTLHASIRYTNEKIRELASHVVAYHFCQADNNNTCLVPDLIHSLAAQLCQAPQLISYREYLLSEPHIQGSLSQRECTVDPDLALSRGIIEPLTILKKTNRLPDVNMVILIDAVCEAEYHRPDRGDTIASFLTRHAPNFPSWLKIVCTVRTQLLECCKQLPYTRISLDRVINDTIGNHVTKDLSDYIGYRMSQSPAIQTNVTASVNGKTESSYSANQTRFASHLLALAKGSFLFAKLTLDLIESGHLVAKSASYKVLPVSLAQIFQLHFNLRFPTSTSFDKVQPLLGVCLAALYPLTLPEIFYSVNSLNTNDFVSWEDFLQRFKMLSGFLVKRLDNTYMFFHPSFREWLMRRDEGESTKFLCDLRLGHAAIAYRLSRLQAPLDGDKALELGHHILKAHVYRGVAPCWPSRDLQAFWLASSSECVSSALCMLRNIYSPNVKVSRLLLLAGASPNHITEYLGNAPILCMYAHEGSVEMVSLLLEFGADVELTNSQGCTALSLAAARGHCDVISRLVAAGASLGHADIAGQCPLVHSARHGMLCAIRYMLACIWETSTNGTEPNGSQPFRLITKAEAAQQALIVASLKGFEAIVEYLLDHGPVFIDHRDNLLGETALTIAATYGATATVCALVARGASPAVLNAKGLSPLMLAAKGGYFRIAETLLQGSLPSRPVDQEAELAFLLKQRDPRGRNALMFAASEGHADLIELFLEKGSPLETTDKEGLTALCWACVKGSTAAAQTLIKRGANVNANDATGRTPLDLAAFQGNPALVQLLLQHEAALEHVDINGMRPLDRAIGCRNIEVVECFLRKGAKLGPATWVMAAGKPDILLMLLNKLMEDGNLLFYQNRLTEASYRYAYALKKFPETTDNDSKLEEPSNTPTVHAKTFARLRRNFLVNHSRCKRKMMEYSEAIRLANEALEIGATYEVLYARGRARMDMNLLQDALSDMQEALRIIPPGAKKFKRILIALRDSIQSKLDGAGTSRESAESSNLSPLRASMDGTETSREWTDNSSSSPLRPTVNGTETSKESAESSSLSPLRASVDGTETSKESIDSSNSSELKESVGEVETSRESPSASKFNQEVIFSTPFSYYSTDFNTHQTFPH